MTISLINALITNCNKHLADIIITYYKDYIIIDHDTSLTTDDINEFYNSSTLALELKPYKFEIITTGLGENIKYVDGIASTYIDEIPSFTQIKVFIPWSNECELHFLVLDKIYPNISCYAHYGSGESLLEKKYALLDGYDANIYSNDYCGIFVVQDGIITSFPAECSTPELLVLHSDDNSITPTEIYTNFTSDLQTKIESLTQYECAKHSPHILRSILYMVIQIFVRYSLNKTTLLISLGLFHIKTKSVLLANPEIKKITTYNLVSDQEKTTLSIEINAKSGSPSIYIIPQYTHKGIRKVQMHMRDNAITDAIIIKATDTANKEKWLNGFSDYHVIGKSWPDSTDICLTLRCMTGWKVRVYDIPDHYHIIPEEYSSYNQLFDDSYYMVDQCMYDCYPKSRIDAMFAPSISKTKAVIDERVNVYTSTPEFASVVETIRINTKYKCSTKLLEQMKAIAGTGILPDNHEIHTIAKHGNCYAVALEKFQLYEIAIKHLSKTNAYYDSIAKEIDSTSHAIDDLKIKYPLLKYLLMANTEDAIHIAEYINYIDSQ
jgi:hypothetical protein